MPESTPANPAAKKLIGDMFGGEGKEARETARAEAGESAAAAAKEEVAERVGSILDEVANGPAEEKTELSAEDAAKAAEAKAVADAKAAETAAAEAAKAAGAAPAGEKPKEGEAEPTVPTWALVAERKEKADLIKEKQRLEAELAAAKAKPAAEVKKEPEDLEPDKTKHPIEWDEWDSRQTKREVAALRAELAEQRKITTEVSQFREIEEKTQEFDRLVAAHREVYAKESPEFTEKREFLRGALMREIEALGMPPQFKGKTPEFAINEMEREMIGVTLANSNDPRAPFKRIEALAEARGYSYFKASQTPKPNGNGGKPAPKTDAERIAAGSKLADAAKTTTTMPGTSPKAPSNTDEMTAEKFAALTPAERRRYKKANPGVLDQLMGGEGDESSIF